MSDRHLTQRDLSGTIKGLRSWLLWLERGRDVRALRVQGILAIIDLAILAFFLFGPYLREVQSYLIIDYMIAVWIGIEICARAILAGDFKTFVRRMMNWVDVFILATLLFPNLLLNFAFLRVMRIWAIGHSNILQEVLRRLGYSQRIDIVRACLSFLVFLFIVTGFVYSSFFYGQGSEGFIDALYFTVATVTTTGFGDITLPGIAGKLTSIVTMIIGISLFVRLAQTIVRPHKVRYPCPQCGLQRHDADAVHCKACGHLLNIPDEGS